jgi:hypothetical protein
MAAGMMHFLLQNQEFISKYCSKVVDPIQKNLSAFAFIETCKTWTELAFSICWNSLKSQSQRMDLWKWINSFWMEEQSTEIDLKFGPFAVKPNNLSESDCSDLASSVIRGFLDIDSINSEFEQCSEEDEEHAGREAIGIKGFIIWTNILLLFVVFVVFYLCKRPAEIEKDSDGSSTEQEVSDVSKSSQDDLETTPETAEVEDSSQEPGNDDESHSTEANDTLKSNLSFDNLETSDDMLESTPDDVLISDSSESLPDILNDDFDQSVLESAVSTSAASLTSSTSTKAQKSTNFIKQNINKFKSAIRPKSLKSQTAGAAGSSQGGKRKSMIPVRSSSARTKLRESTC